MITAVFVTLAALPAFAFWGKWGRKDKKPKPAAAPEWASFFTGEEYEAFVHEVQRYFQRQEIGCRIHDGVVYVLSPGEEEPAHQYGLQNLAQVCKGEPRDEWGRCVEMHFAAMDQSNAEVEAFREKKKDFAAVRDLLRVRLGPADMPTDIMVKREDLPGTVSYIVIDLPSAMVTVSADELSAWGVSEAALFELAVSKLQAEPPEKCDVLALDDGISLQVMMGNSFLTASHALRLQDFPGMVGKLGSLVAVPHRHVLIVYPIEGAEVVGVVHRLAAIAQGMYREGPGSISPEVYWFDQGVYEVIPCVIEGDKLIVRPPERFVTMLTKISEETTGE